MPEGRVAKEDRAAKVGTNQAIIQEILHSTGIESDVGVSFRSQAHHKPYIFTKLDTS